MIEFDAKIKVMVQQQFDLSGSIISATVIKLVELPAKKYGYLAIHLNLHIDPDKLLARDFKLPGIYAITHIPKQIYDFFVNNPVMILNYGITQIKSLIQL